MDILIVEDGFHEREQVQKLFSDAGYQVDAVDCAEEAERLLKVGRYRLALLDVGLADKSGSFLFDVMKRSGAVSYIVILTGNPSVHLKSKFLDDGADAYLVKGSPEASNAALLETVSSLIGTSVEGAPDGIPLIDFIGSFIAQESKDLFLDTDRQIVACSVCGARDYIVTFSHKAQVPPLIEGQVVCTQCGTQLDPNVG